MNTLKLGPGVLVLLFSGCGSDALRMDGGGFDAVAPDVGEPAPAPVRGTGACSNVEIVYFRAMPSIVDPGAAVTLSWNGSMARGCDLQPGNASFGGGPLSWQVMPSTTTEYSLRCYGTACLTGEEAPVARVTVRVR
jgi:hypothetical protein